MSIDRVFAQWNRQDSPGCAIAIVDNGKSVLERGYGMANLEHSVPINEGNVDLLELAGVWDEDVSTEPYCALLKTTQACKLWDLRHLCC